MLNIRTLKKHYSALLLIVLFASLSACSGDDATPEEQVREVIRQIESAAKERSNSGIMQHVSESYSDHKGLTKQDIRKLITVQLLRNQKISAFSIIHSIKVEAGVAQVEMSSAISGRDLDLSKKSNRLNADLFRFSLILLEEDSDWKITSASWKQGW